MKPNPIRMKGEKIIYQFKERSRNKNRVDRKEKNKRRKRREDRFKSYGKHKAKYLDRTMLLQAPKNIQVERRRTNSSKRDKKSQMRKYLQGYLEGLQRVHIKFQRSA